MTMTGFMDTSLAAGQQYLTVDRNPARYNPLPVTANAASPLIAGAQFNNPRVTRTNGQTGPLEADSVGNLSVTLGNSAGSSFAAVASMSTTTATSTQAISTRGISYINDGTATLIAPRSVMASNNTQAIGTQSADVPLWSVSDLTANVINFSASGDNTIIAGVGGQTIRVHRLRFVAAAPTNITIKDGAGTVLEGPITMTAGGAMVLDLSGRPYYRTSVGNAFVINSSAAVQVGGRVEYVQSV